MIPKRLHRLWLGARTRPARYDEYWDEWRRLHPDWTLITWTEGNLPPLRNAATCNLVRQSARSAGITMASDRAVAVQLADVIAYELVWRYGGVYVNCDVEPFRSFNPLLEHAAFAGWVEHGFLANSIMGGERESAFFDAVVQELPSWSARHRGVGMEVETGPHLLSAMANKYPHLITCLPREAFYFAHNSQILPGGDSEPFADRARAAGAYALHHWGHKTQEGDVRG